MRLMIFKETTLHGAFIVEPERFEDERGFLERTWSEQEFAERELESHVVECRRSFNARKGTIRGMHYQAVPYGQVKIVSCPHEAIYDVIIDPTSPIFKRWEAVELSEDNGLMLYIP